MFLKNKLLKAILLGSVLQTSFAFAADYPVEVNSLHYAVSINKTSYVESLILDEPNLVAQFNKDGLTPIHVAIDSNSLSSLKVLLQNKSNPNIKNAFEETPLIYAIKKEKLSYAKELMKYGANPKIEDSTGANALFYAKKSGKEYENLFISKKEIAKKKASEINNSELKSFLIQNQIKLLKELEIKILNDFDKKLLNVEKEFSKQNTNLKKELDALNLNVSKSMNELSVLKEELKLTDLNQLDSDSKIETVDKKIEIMMNQFINFENSIKQIHKKIEQSDQKAMISLYSKDSDEESVEILKIGDNSSTMEVQEKESVDVVTFGEPKEVDIIDEDTSLDF